MFINSRLKINNNLCINNGSYSRMFNYCTFGTCRIIIAILEFKLIYN